MDEAVLFYVEMLRQADKLGYPVILKSAVGGYDGKGQWKFNTRDELLFHIVDVFRDNPTEKDIQEFEAFYEEILSL